MYESSVAKGGVFAGNVIGTVAAGNISSMGTMTGEKAAQALHSYMGYAALEGLSLDPHLKWGLLIC